MSTRAERAERAARAAAALADLKVTPHAEGARVHVLRWGSRWEWAIVAIHEATGLVAISSSFGAWAFTWHPSRIAESSVHRFVARSDEDYAMGKMIPREQREVVDIEGTRVAYREQIIEWRRSGRLDRETAREYWTEVSEWDEENHARQELPGYGFRDAWWMSDAFELVRHTLSSEARGFCEQVWPAVRRAAREEAERIEASASAAVPA